MWIEDSLDKIVEVPHTIVMILFAIPFILILCSIALLEPIYYLIFSIIVMSMLYIILWVSIKEYFKDWLYLSLLCLFRSTAIENMIGSMCYVPDVVPGVTFYMIHTDEISPEQLSKLDGLNYISNEPCPKNCLNTNYDNYEFHYYIKIDTSKHGKLWAYIKYRFVGMNKLWNY